MDAVELELQMHNKESDSRNSRSCNPARTYFPLLALFKKTKGFPGFHPAPSLPSMGRIMMSKPVCHYDWTGISTILAPGGTSMCTR